MSNKNHVYEILYSLMFYFHSIPLPFFLLLAFICTNIYLANTLSLQILTLAILILVICEFMLKRESGYRCNDENLPTAAYVAAEIKAVSFVSSWFVIPLSYRKHRSTMTASWTWLHTNNIFIVYNMLHLMSYRDTDLIWFDLIWFDLIWLVIANI